MAMSVTALKNFIPQLIAIAARKAEMRGNSAVSQDIARTRAEIKRKPGESDQSLAVRLFYAQTEVYSSWSGQDLSRDFSSLDRETKEGWYRAAQEHDAPPIHPIDDSDIETELCQ